VVLIQESTALPGDEPVAWRETTKRSLGTMRYLFRVFVALEFPVAFLCVLMAGGGDAQFSGPSALLGIVWLLAVLMIAVQSASLISGERTHQTLDVLLTTPLSGREILRQKLRGVRRLMAVLAIPFATIFFFEAWLKGTVGTGAWGYTGSERFSPVRYLITSGLTVGIYLPMIAWLSAWIGLRARTQTRAMMGALATILGWCVLPPLCLIPTVQMLHLRPDAGWGYLLLLSPMVIVPLNEDNQFWDFPGGPWSVVVLNFAIYGPCLFWFRQLALRSADRLQEGTHAR
jgi:hypothetical protein